MTIEFKARALTMKKKEEKGVLEEEDEEKEKKKRRPWKGTRSVTPRRTFKATRCVRPRVAAKCCCVLVAAVMIVEFAASYMRHNVLHAFHQQMQL